MILRNLRLDVSKMYSLVSVSCCILKHKRRILFLSDLKAWTLSGKDGSASVPVNHIKRNEVFKISHQYLGFLLIGHSKEDVSSVPVNHLSIDHCRTFSTPVK